jgi:hypothetical protein
MMKWIPYGPNALLLQFADRVGDEAFDRSRAIVAELIGSSAGDYAPAPSHTTVRAVFRIRRLNPAAFHMMAASSDGIQNP